MKGLEKQIKGLERQPLRCMQPRPAARRLGQGREAGKSRLGREGCGAGERASEGSQSAQRRRGGSTPARRPNDPPCVLPRCPNPPSCVPFSLKPQCTAQLRLGSTPRPFLRSHSCPASTFSRPLMFSMGMTCRAVGNTEEAKQPSEGAGVLTATATESVVPPRRAAAAPSCAPRRLARLEHGSLQQLVHRRRLQLELAQQRRALRGVAQQAQHVQPDLAGDQLPPVLAKVLKQKGGGGDRAWAWAGSGRLHQACQHIGISSKLAAASAACSQQRRSSSGQQQHRRLERQWHAPAAAAFCRRSRRRAGSALLAPR